MSVNATPQPDSRGRPKLASTQSSSTSVISPPPQGRRVKLKAHGRSLSLNKLNKLSASTASPHVRPNLNRSKSTDGLTRNKLGPALKRNRSFTKTTGLFQPLTKTNSSASIRPNKSASSLKGMAPTNAGLKTSGRKGRAILKLNDDDDNYEDDPNGSSESRDQDKGNDDHHEESQNVVGENYTHVPQNEVTRQNRQPRSESSEHTLHNDSSENNPPKGYSNQFYQKSFSSEPEIDTIGALKSSESSTKKDESNMSTRSSTDDLSNNMYGGSLLLSQSTGLTKKIDNRKDAYNGYPSFTDNSLNNSSGISFNAKEHESHKIAEPVITSKNAVQNNSYQPNQTIFNNLQRTNSQYLSTKRQQSGQQILNLQQQQLHLHLQNLQGQRGLQKEDNFADFLNTANEATEPSSPNNIKTRAQQRLWLQRENSLLDISMLDPSTLNNFSNLSLSNLMFAQNYTNSLQGKEPTTPGMTQQQAANFFSNHSNNSSGDLENGTRTTPLTTAHNMQLQLAQKPPPPTRTDSSINGLLLMFQNSNSIQSRTEFERLNREYLNVRRNLNPVGETLDRTDKYLKSATPQIEVAKTRKSTNNGSDSPNNIVSGNTFEEVSTLYPDKEQEVNLTLNRLWQEAASSIAIPQGAVSHRVPSQTNLLQQLQILQRPANLRMASLNNQSVNLRATRR